MKKFYVGVVAGLLLMVGVLFSNSNMLRAEDQAAAPAPAAVAPVAAEPAAAVEPVIDEAEAEGMDEAKVLKDAAAKLKGIANDPDAAKLAKQLEELASDYEY